MTCTKAVKIKIGDSIRSKDGYTFTVNKIEEKPMPPIQKNTLYFMEHQQEELMCIIIISKLYD